MIIDFNYPTLTTDGWRIEVHKILPNGKHHNQVMRFEDKDDAFAFYKKAQEVWRNQHSQRSR